MRSSFYLIVLVLLSGVYSHLNGFLFDSLFNLGKQALVLEVEKAKQQVGTAFAQQKEQVTTALAATQGQIAQAKASATTAVTAATAAGQKAITDLQESAAATVTAAQADVTASVSGAQTAAAATQEAAKKSMAQIVTVSEGSLTKRQQTVAINLTVAEKQAYLQALSVQQTAAKLQGKAYADMSDEEKQLYAKAEVARQKQKQFEDAARSRMPVVERLPYDIKLRAEAQAMQEEVAFGLIDDALTGRELEVYKQAMAAQKVAAGLYVKDISSLADAQRKQLVEAQRLAEERRKIELNALSRLPVKEQKLYKDAMWQRQLGGIALHRAVVASQVMPFLSEADKAAYERAQDTLVRVGRATISSMGSAERRQYAAAFDARSALEEKVFGSMSDAKQSALKASFDIRAAYEVDSEAVKAGLLAEPVVKPEVAASAEGSPASVAPLVAEDVGVTTTFTSASGDTTVAITTQGKGQKKIIRRGGSIYGAIARSQGYS